MSAESAVLARCATRGTVVELTRHPKGSRDVRFEIAVWQMDTNRRGPLKRLGYPLYRTALAALKRECGHNPIRRVNP